ncbi:cytochrome c [Pedobacter sp. SYSU D00535]|uniref:c-type cytochrome n=1 Tax=Pedobacter sp. SYSU D00535 TaxID=2810308 RepID=UPI001A9788DE|nr:cytochrome c [Pedobacter sp. SYSU D00535]
MRNKVVCLFFLAIALLVTVQACQTEEQLKYAQYYTNGKALYDQHCQNCHNSDGKGLANLVPPLTDTTYLKNHKNELACIIKHGLKDTIMVDGRQFSGEMPANHQMPDIDIAAIVTYITNSFGNKQGLYDVSNAGSDLKGCEH